MTWKSLASVDITVSVDSADSIAVFESEKITALSSLFWCRFSRRSVVLWLRFLHQRQSNVVPVAYSRRKVHSGCRHQRLCIHLLTQRRRRSQKFVVLALSVL